MSAVWNKSKTERKEVVFTTAYSCLHPHSLVLTKAGNSIVHHQEIPVCRKSDISSSFYGVLGIFRYYY